MPLMSPRVAAQIKKEFLCLLRDPKSRFILIGPPLVQLLIFSFAATLELKHVDLAVNNRDYGTWGHELEARLGGARFVHQLHPVRSEDEIRNLVDRREVMAALIVPENFSRAIESGQAAPVQIILDGRRANATQLLLGYLNSLIDDLNAEAAGNRHPMPDRLTIRHWFNPNLNYPWFVVPSLGGTMVMFVTLLVTSLSIARERELGTFDQLMVSPCTPIEIIFAKMAPALCIGLLLGLIMAALAIGLFNTPFTGSLLPLLASLLLFILSIIGIGLMISSICNTQQQAILGTFAVGVPAVLMSGFATPVENMPRILQWLAQAIPLKHYLIILQGSFLKAMPTSEIIANAWPLALIAAITLPAATFFVRSKLQ